MNRERKHNPTMLAAKRATRALGVAWSEVCEERDRLRQAEADDRHYLEVARKTAWSYWRTRMGWSPSQESFWRNGFQRVFGRKMARGADYTVVRFHDEIAESVRCNVPELANDSTDDIWALLLSPYEPRTPVDSWYQLALANILHGRASVASVTQTAAAPF